MFVFVAPAVIEAVAPLHTELDLSKLVDSCPDYQETPLLLGDTLVLDRVDRYSNTSYTLCQVLNMKAIAIVGDDGKNDWEICIKIIIDDHKKLTMLNFVTAFAQLFKNASTNRYSSLQPPAPFGTEPPPSVRPTVSMVVWVAFDTISCKVIIII